MESRLRIHAASDVGRKRSRNEDSFWIPENHSDSDRAMLLVLADGMGGAPAGDVASRLAVDSVASAFASSESTAEILECLRRALEGANRAVYAASRSRADWLGMGTTCTAMAVRGSEAWIAHVGDSRAYRVRGGWALQLTEDHSLVGGRVRAREITAEQARTDSLRHLVTRCVGTAETVLVDAFRLDLGVEPGDTLILCSDGLHDTMSDRELGVLASNSSLEKACRDLIDLANRRGGPDNITVIAARIEPVRPADDRREATLARGMRALMASTGGGLSDRHGAARRSLAFLLAALAISMVVWWAGFRPR